MADVENKTVPTRGGEEDIGTVKIADDVVATIIATAAQEVEGVAGLQGNAGEGWLKKAGYKRPTSGVRVDMDNGNVKADIALQMDYGYNIPATSSKVQARVKQAVENMTGLHVEDVNVRIAGIRMPQDDSDAGESKE